MNSFLFSFITLIQTAYGHPVTFKGGTAVSSVHRPRMTHLQINYTFHRHAAVATSFVRLDLDDEQYDIEAPIVHMNTLVKRWNQLGSQGNIYAITGLGYNFNPEAESQPFAYMGLQIDYETQRIYTALQGFSFVSDINSHIPYGVRYRFGAAPYIADYDELQIWVIAQVDHMSDMSEQPRFTPMLRLFYRTVLWEMGQDLQGRYWFQMMAHF